MTKLEHKGTGRTKKVVDGPRCRWCRHVMPCPTGAGRPRLYCTQACRQWDWVARQRARELAISENDLVVARAELDRLHDDLYVLACAVDDTERELATSRQTAASLRETLDWLLEAARPLKNRTLTQNNS